MEDTSNTQGNQLRQPKKRFVGRRTADAQAQKDSTSQADVETTAVQKGMHGLSALDGSLLIQEIQRRLDAHLGR